MGRSHVLTLPAILIVSCIACSDLGLGGNPQQRNDKQAVDESGSPSIEDDTDTSLKPPTAHEAAERLLALLAVVGHVHQPEQTQTWMARHQIESYLSESERAFVSDLDPTEENRVEFSWRAEAAVSIIWALKGLDRLPPLNEQFALFENPMVQSAFSNPSEFLATATLRPASTIRTMEDHLYNQHWRVRDAQLFGKPMPPELDPGIVYERRYAMSWLAGWGDDWDTVPTDT